MNRPTDELDQKIMAIPDGFSARIRGREYHFGTVSRPRRCGTDHGGGRLCGSVVTGGKYVATAAGVEPVEFTSYVTDPDGIVADFRKEEREAHNKTLLKAGVRVRVVDFYQWNVLADDAWQGARRGGAAGVIVGGLRDPFRTHTWVVRHDDGTLAPYSVRELEIDEGGVIA